MGGDKPIYGRFVDLLENFLQVTREKQSGKKISIMPETRIYEDLGVDSLEAMDLIAAIEAHFCITVDAPKLVAKKHVGDIVAYIESLTNRTKG